MAGTPQPLRVALAQMNPTVGDIEGNAERIAAMTRDARERGAALVMFPELTVTGYPPEDLLLKTNFLDAAARALEALAADTRGIVALVGFPERVDDVYNSAAVLADGEVAAVYRKMWLPNYRVFDEGRYFQAGHEPALVRVNDSTLGLSICEDMWETGDPVSAEAMAGADLIVNLSASPYHVGKGPERERMLIQRARDNLVAVAFCNLVGGQDELVFDGHSVVVDHEGRVLARAPQFRESIVLATVDPAAASAERLQDARHRAAVRRRRASADPPVPTLAELTVAPAAEGSHVDGEVAPLLGPEEEAYTALITGLRDYVAKNRFDRVVLGLSGGIDSALVALVAVDALGPERVSCVVMPSPYSSQDTQSDARLIAERLGVELIELEIGEAMQTYERLLRSRFDGSQPGIAEENLQARIRGNLLMALSNRFGWLVLTTGNKSELSVGYATLYGDMAGGFAVLKDVFKGWVYRLVRWRNEREGEGPVPASVLERPPSAELRHGQRDEDSLPPYDVLDPILEAYVERDLDAAQIVSRGLPEEEVRRVIGLVDRAEYKRRQAPPGIRISTKAFGRDRRLPITNRFSG